MTKYHVEVRQQKNVTYVIEARDSEDAEARAVIEGEPITTYYNTRVDSYPSREESDNLTTPVQNPDADGEYGHTRAPNYVAYPVENGVAGNNGG